MRKRPILFAILLVASIAAASMPHPQEAQGWSDDSHRIVTTKAIEFLPQGWRQFFASYGATLNQTCLYPDLVDKSLLPNEDPRHYIDLEVWSPSDSSTGTLPQAVEEFTKEMANSLKAGDWNTALLLAGRVAHYVQDIHQPYHATVNYNPNGLHLTLDESLAKYYSRMTTVTPAQAGPILPVANLTDFVFQIARQSNSFLLAINNTLIIQGKSWSSELTAIIQNRTNAAIVDTARVWVTAITGAGVSAPIVPSVNTLTVSITGGLTSNGSLDSSKDANLTILAKDELGVGALGTITASLGSSPVTATAVTMDLSPLGKYSVQIPSSVLKQFVNQQVVLSLSIDSSGHPEATKSIPLRVLAGSLLPLALGDTTLVLLIAVAVVFLLLGAALLIRAGRR